ncbi:unnamed protein product [Kuraishia capsulata CBS 1993]|uniref:Protein STU1 n=1 Tax=Kuraishia capsulata CBS 1993 TaxID=1382522 RepID=W6MLD2_9ASCO|nr:uncharacterized protein KUCA_T00003287001 [Kuraishia capsulata CBS 1993]CDK27309.1 unnamed protein product [Kuraishia capsulata CBS 1993]
MSMPIDAEALYAAVSGYDTSHCLQLLSDLKAHIKRDFVNLEFVPRYFEALSLASNSPDANINSTAFTCTSHLIKRVTMQDPSILKIVDYLVIPTLLSKLDDSKQIMARKSLLTYWEFCPHETELILKDSGLTHENHTIRKECLSLLSEIIRSGKTIQFKPLLRVVVGMLDIPGLGIPSADLLTAFYLKGTSSRIARQDLLKELNSQSISERTAINVLFQIDARLVEEYKFSKEIKHEAPAEQSQFVNAGAVRVSARATGERHAQERTKAKPVLASVRKAAATAIHAPRTAPTKETPIVHSVPKTRISNSQALNELLDSVSGYEMENIEPVHLYSTDALRDEIEGMYKVFEGKESEHNWEAREKNIIRLRRVVRGQLIETDPRGVAMCFRSLCEQIGKAVGSLRTTLSSHGCQLVKEACIFIGEYFDSTTVEFLAMPLVKLSSARKSISHHNAHVGMCGLLVHTHFNMRVVTQVHNASLDKNMQPRAYAATWFQILLLKNMDDKALLVSSGTLDFIEKSVAKGVSDPAPAVRESMRITFWTLHSGWPHLAEKIMSKCDNNSKKALERARNTSIAMRSTSDSRAGSRPSSSLLIKRSTSGTAPVTGATRTFSNGLASASLTARRTMSGNRMASNPKKPAEGGTVRCASQEKPKPTLVAPVAQSATLMPDIVAKVPTSSAGAESTQERPSSHQEDLPRDDASVIFDYFTDKDKAKQSEGIDMLISLIRNKEDLDDKFMQSFKETLSDISLASPELLSSLISLELLPKTCRLFFANDLIRIAALKYGNDTQDESAAADILVDSIPTEDLCFALIETLSCAADVSKVQNPHISLQFFKHRQLFALFSIQTLSILFGKLPVLEYLMTDTIEALLSCWYLLADTKIDLLSLLSLIKFKNEVVFNRGLNSCDPAVKSSVCAELGLIANEQEEEPEALYQDTTQGFGRIEMTMIRPGKSILGLDPGQVTNSDMTMILPNLKNRTKPFSARPSFLEETAENPPRDSSDVEGVNDHGVDDAFHQVANTGYDEDVEMPTKEQLEHPSTPQRSHAIDTENLINTMEKVRLSPKVERLQDFKNVKLFPSPEAAKDVEHIINQSDPFSLVTSSRGSDAIQVYEDKAEELDSWSGLQGQISGYLNKRSPHIHHIITEGNYMDVSDLNVEEKLEAVLTIRQTLGNDHAERIWLLLLALSSNNSSDELSLAIEETVESLVETSSTLVFQKSIEVVSNVHDVASLNFVLNSLMLTLEKASNVTVDQANMVDAKVFDYLSHPGARVRRVTIGIYAHLMAVFTGYTRRTGKSVANHPHTDLDIFKKFSPPQLKLVEFYSEKV